MRISSLALVFFTAAAFAGPADWLTDGGDSKRNNWQKNETILTKASVKGMQLLWKKKLDNQPRQMHSLL
ncbi:MAG: pyrrolo-quinoline quinone, partial [Acidobacteriota bacterium]